MRNMGNPGEKAKSERQYENILGERLTRGPESRAKELSDSSLVGISLAAISGHHMLQTVRPRTGHLYSYP